jgi:hypothetical protein
MDKQKKLIKVTMEYSDGEVSYLDGEDAAKWESAANGVIMFNYAHGVHFPQFKWKKVKKKDGV